MSSITKASSSSNEESGWTTYFEDFFNNQNDNHNCSISLSCVLSSSSFLSDDASKKLAHKEQAEEFSLDKNTSQRPSFKKRKNIITDFVDDSLEDTATSPLNSPKVLYAIQFENPKQIRQKK
ncbi:hypothetical protein TanjilG_19668 [Lupinus angustifolius]|uniref:Uncharacterized protein n=1 Tax=Lupinus angustifolius TaxID=3871 RepID=A0A1J7HBR6_LUPAN|nr:hypothetical protein TanjilG_19668 [Lupinus angustifolius]